MKKTNIFILMGILLIIIGITLIDFFEEKEAEIKETHTFEYFKVNITGEVLRDGVYEVPSDWVLNDLLDICGVGKNANLSKVNLLEKLEANKTYYIPSVLDIEVDNLLININLATQEELESLPGIGPSLAAAIIEYRMYKNFETVEEIMEVAGIGLAIYEKIRPYIAI